MRVEFVGPGSPGADEGSAGPFDGAQLADVGYDLRDNPAPYQQRGPGGGLQFDQPVPTALSIQRLITGQGAVPSHVTAVDVQAGRLIVLHADAGDLLAPGDPGVPFGNGLPPVLSPDSFTGDINGYVNYRTVPTGRVGYLDDGAQFSANNGSTMLITVHLDGALLSPVVQNGPSTIAAKTPFTIAAGLRDGSDPGRYGWTWDFGDGGTATGFSTTHTFAKPGTYTVQAAAEGTGSDRSSGRSAPVTIQVTPAVSSPPPSTSPPAPSPSVQPSLGNGAPSGANGGPVSGNGSRIGGVATSRPGGGAPGPSFDPRSSAAPASGAAPSATAGGLVGQLLAGPDVPFALPSQAAARPLDDTAPAARSGVGPGLLGWLAGALVVVALLVLGAGTERRRPTHVRRTRLPTRRAR